MAVSERIETWRRERRVLTRVARAAWRLRSAERERDWALASAREAGISIRKLAAEAGLSPSRVHQLLAARDSGALDVAVGQLREVGWPAPEDPDTGDDDTELDGRDLICDRLDDEAAWLRQAGEWLGQLAAGGYPPAVNLRPSEDWPDSANVAVNQPRVAALLDRTAHDIEELARARRVDELHGAAVLPARPASRASPASGRTRPGLPHVLPRQTHAQLLTHTARTRLGRLAIRAAPPRRDRPVPRLQQQPVPAALTPGRRKPVS